MQDIFGISPVIPVVVIDDADHAVPMARALRDGGISVVEITLRTPAAIESIKRIADEVPEVAVGAGTILNAADLDAATGAGARFFISPGLTLKLLAEAAERKLTYFPGVATAAEIMMALNHGFDTLKLFPAAQLGADYIKSFAGPFPQVRFCTTGGISRDNAATFLALPNVACVGASWVATPQLMAGGDWSGIEANARFAAGLA